MKIFIQDHKWAGASIVIAENEEQAREILRKKREEDFWHYYDDSKRFDFIEEVKPGVNYEVFGDR